ncbi:hypothetical protein E5288_WYG003293 [Bos mutus]|uniref:Uncharacterized protein n=1 Tax=Bos mutus TaxID=72004 RepID=A0A6B0S9A5_9CETA|nr:hypothetical protein [Bos mutus]
MEFAPNRWCTGRGLTTSCQKRVLISSICWLLCCESSWSGKCFEIPKAELGRCKNSPHLSFPAFRSVSYSSTNSPSVAYEKRLRRLTEALTCPERSLLKLLFSSSGQVPCPELLPTGVSGCL